MGEKINKRASDMGETVLIFLDFEATCDDSNNDKSKKLPPHIIEWPSMAFTLTGDRLEPRGSVFHRYVRPPFLEMVTPFCTDLTGITPESLEACGTFPEVEKEFVRWYEETVGYEESKRVIFVTCGDWDIATCLPFNYKHHKCGRMPGFFSERLNLKTLLPRGKSLTDVCEMYFPEEGFVGRLHSGIDDTRNMVRVFGHLLETQGIEGLSL